MPLLNVRQYGPDDAPPVLALHGITGWGGRFRRLAEEALPDRRVLAVDLRGHGESLWAPPFSVPQHVDDLLDTLDQLGEERVPIVGHSFGGLLACELAVRAPGRVERLALLDPAMQLDAVDALGAAEEACVVNWFPTLEALQEARAGTRRPAAAAAARADAAEHHLVLEDGSYRLRFCPQAEVVGWTEMARPAPSPACPILVVTAGQADYVTDPVRHALRAGAGKGGFSEVVLDCDHMVFWDAFDETAAAVRGFLAS
jgi:lipase